MSNLPVDRDKNYMKSMWGTSKLITDYDSLNKSEVKEDKDEFLQEITNYKLVHDLKKQTDIHETIRNDDDYDDWEYGTEPTYGKKW
jgi:hypothetical protein